MASRLSAYQASNYAIKPIAQVREYLYSLQMTSGMWGKTIFESAYMRVCLCASVVGSVRVRVRALAA